jgi:hypothetical protein
VGRFDGSDLVPTDKKFTISESDDIKAILA